MQTLAYIIPLPTAADSTVVQSRRSGRYPKGVVSMRAYQRYKLRAFARALAIEREVVEHRDALNTFEEVLHTRRKWVEELAKSAKHPIRKP